MEVIFGRTPADYAGTVVCCECASAVGQLFVAWTDFGLCAVAFADGADEMRERLARRLPRAAFAQGSIGSFENFGSLRLAPVGTDFQLEVWRALTCVPRGSVATYTQIAAAVGRPSALRAVGTAIGANPLAILVPCHRIVPAQGGVGRYHWGSHRKLALLRAEGIDL